MDEVDRQIINHLQQGFPVCDTPYEKVANTLGLSESDLLKRLKELLDSGVLSRFGPMYHAGQMGGALTLAAIKVPLQRFEEVTALVNSFPEVAHNYRRAHELNMWFVIATDNADRVLQVLQEIERQSGLKVFNMPKLKEYFVQLQLQA